MEFSKEEMTHRIVATSGHEMDRGEQKTDTSQCKTPTAGMYKGGRASMGGRGGRLEPPFRSIHPSARTSHETYRTTTYHSLPWVMTARSNAKLCLVNCAMGFSREERACRIVTTPYHSMDPDNKNSLPKWEKPTVGMYTDGEASMGGRGRRLEPPFRSTRLSARTIHETYCATT